jgi:hypothetical protein
VNNGWAGAVKNSSLFVAGRTKNMALDKPVRRIAIVSTSVIGAHEKRKGSWPIGNRTGIKSNQGQD